MDNGRLRSVSAGYGGTRAGKGNNRERNDNRNPRGKDVKRNRGNGRLPTKTKGKA